MTLDDFLGRDTPHAPPIVVLPEAFERRLLHRFQPIRPLKTVTDCGTYLFHEGAFDADPVLHAAVGLSWHLPKLVLCMSKDGARVGFTHNGMVFVLPEHRGRGLGVELIAQLYLLCGPELWCDRNHARSLTSLGHAAMTKAYCVLAEQGLLPA